VIRAAAHTPPEAPPAIGGMMTTPQHALVAAWNAADLDGYLKL
jgi:hypothetical protein